MFLSFENRRNWCKDMSKALLHCLLLNLSHFVHLIFLRSKVRIAARDFCLLYLCVCISVRSLREDD